MKRAKFGFTLAEGATHIAMQHNTRKLAFTLAEVLVTLAVIGIVAAMTIPNLVQSYKKKEVETKLVKFYSTMNNAVKLAEVDYGPQTTWTDYYEDTEYDDKGNQLYQKGDKYDAHINKYFAPYIKITGSEEINKTKVYYLSDGSAFGFSLKENRELDFYPFNPKDCLLNSSSDKQCSFLFAFIPGGNIGAFVTTHFKYNISNGVQPNLYFWDGNEDSLKTSDYGCNKNGTRNYCAEVIRRNGWKIPDDYPFKF